MMKWWGRLWERCNTQMNGRTHRQTQATILPLGQNWAQVKNASSPYVCTTGPSLTSPCHQQVWRFLCLLAPTAPPQTPGVWHSFPSVVTMGVWRNVSVLISSGNRSVLLNWQICKMWRGRTTDKTLFGEEDSEVSVVESLFGDLRCTAGGLGMTGGSCCGAETRAPSQYKDRLISVWRFPC